LMLSSLSSIDCHSWPWDPSNRATGGRRISVPSIARRGRPAARYGIHLSYQTNWCRFGCGAVQWTGL